MHIFSIFIQVVAITWTHFTHSMPGSFLHAVDDYHRGIWVNDYEYVGCCTDVWANGKNFNYSITAEPGDFLKLKVENFSGRQGFVGIVQLGSSDEGRFDSNTYDSYWSNPDGITRYTSGYTLYGTYLDLLGNYKSKYSYYTFRIPYFSTCDNYPETFTINYSQVITLNFNSWIKSKVPNAERVDRLFVRFRENSFGSVIVENTSEVADIEANYPLDIDYTFKPNADIYGHFTWYYYGYSISEDASSDCKVDINICYPSCFSCSSTADFTPSEHHCILCFEGFAKVEIDGVVASNCYDISWIQLHYPNYYLDQTYNTFYPCYEKCATCHVKGDSVNHSCSSCDKNIDWHLIVSYPGNCVSSPQNGYAWNEETNTYVYCYSSCSECDGIGIENNNYCTKCKNGFIHVDKTQNCVSEKPERYYLTVDEQGNQIYKECYFTCNTCESGGEEGNHNCISCYTSYFYLEGNDLNCYHVDTIPSNTYLNDGITYKYCYDSCATCDTKGDETDNKCLSCKSPNYWHEINFNCYHRNEKPLNFYYDDVNRVFKTCHSTCATCATGGNVTVHNCDSCIKEYSFITTSPSNCIDKLTKPDNFYYDSTDNTLRPCHVDCQTCRIGPDPDTPSKKNCETCWTNYYFLTPKADGNCIHESAKPSNYYLDEESQTYYECFNTCKQCDNAGDEWLHNCKECLNNDYHWAGLNSNNCVDEDNKANNTYLDVELDTYWPCHSNCSQCLKKEETNKNNCQVCIENYYFIDDIEDGNCIAANDKPSNYYLLDDYIFQPCYDSCRTCLIGGSEEKNNCSTCRGSYHWIINQEYQCVHEHAKPENYYWDTDDTFKPCHEACRKCLTINNDSSTSTNCVECIDNYYFLDEKEWGNCISERNKPDDYYLDTDDTYKKCHDNCATCDNGAIEGDTKCIICSSSYFFESEESSNCVNVIPEGYYLNGDFWKQCYHSCLTCWRGLSEDHTTHNCEECKDNYHWIIDINSNCINEHEKPENYYWDEWEGIFKQCHENCSRCSSGPNENKNNCDACRWDYVFIGDKSSGNCIDTALIPGNYYFDDYEGTYLPCYESCGSCTTAADTLNSIHNCLSCKTNYYFQGESSSNCFDSAPQKHYWDMEKEIYFPCYMSCESCTVGGNAVEHNCDSCILTYHWIFGKEKNCINEAEKPSNYYYDEGDDMFKPCHNNCKTCNVGEDDSNYNCLSCNAGYYFRLPFEEGNCVDDSDSKTVKYYFDDNHGVYAPCYINCSTCKAGKDGENSNCDTCVDNYYFWDNDTTGSNCYDTSPYENYYFDNSENIFKECYRSCRSCAWGISDNKHNCNACKQGYYFIEGYSTNCINEDEKPENYYWDTSDAGNHMYRKCHFLCKSCNSGGTEGNNNCWTCVSGDRAWIASKPNNCIPITDEIDNYYYDPTTKAFEACFDTCLRCTDHGVSNSNNCSLCINDHAFIETQPSNCIIKGSQPKNYYYDSHDNTYKYISNCYNTCESCFNKGDRDTHYCLQCEYDWEYTTGSPEKGNCYDLNTITLEEITLKDFVPLDRYDTTRNDNSGEPFEFKEIKMDNYTMYYYTTRTVFKSTNCPIIRLNECEDILRNEYNINDDEDIIIAEIVNNEYQNVLEYKVYRHTGEELNLQVCTDENARIDKHLYMLRERVNYMENVELQNKIERIASTIQIEEWFNTNSSFYNDPCLAFSIDNKDYTLSLRRDIYENDILTCGKDCAYNSSFINNNTLICKCTISNQLNIEERFTGDQSSILSCLHLLSSFPAISETWSHWMIFGAIGLQIAGCSLFWFSNLKDLTKVIACSVTNPPLRNNFTIKGMELQELGRVSANSLNSLSNLRSLHPNNENRKSSVRILPMKDQVSEINVKEKEVNVQEETERKQEKIFTKEELNNLNKSNSFLYDKRSNSRYCLDMLKEKLILISLFTHERQHLPISIQIIIQAFILSLTLSWSSIFSSEKYLISRFFANSIIFHLITKELGTAVSIGWISYLISRILFVIVKYGLYTKKNTAKEGWKFICIFKIKVVVISSITWIVNIMLWIYTYVFGMIYQNNQLTVFILSIISLIFLLIFQIIICCLLTYLRHWTRKNVNSQWLFSMSFFAYWLL